MEDASGGMGSFGRRSHGFPQRFAVAPPTGWNSPQTGPGKGDPIRFGSALGPHEAIPRGPATPPGLRGPILMGHWGRRTGLCGSVGPGREGPAGPLPCPYGQPLVPSGVDGPWVPGPVLDADGPVGQARNQAFYFPFTGGRTVNQDSDSGIQPGRGNLTPLQAISAAARSWLFLRTISWRLPP